MSLSDDILNNAREYARLQADINSGLSGYLEGVEKLKKLNESINTVQKNINDLLKEDLRLKNLGVDKDDESRKLIQAKINLLEKQNDKLKTQHGLYKEVIKDAKTLNMTITATGAALTKGVWNLPKNFMGKMGVLGGLFEMDKAIRTTVTSMGTLGKQSDIVRQNIKAAALNTNSFGAGIKEIAEIQAQYTETLGRNVMLSQQSLESIAEMGKSTGLGIEGATQMASEFDKMGVSAEKTGMFVQQVLDDSSKLGLNATKIMKNIAGNIKMLNKYRFKDGVKGLVEMAKLATKLGVEVDFAAGMADKLWNIEGAVEMSAQLNVMGGAWAQMADPFKLMYQARNDIKGLTENIAKAAAASMSFAQDGSIELNALEMHRLKIIAEQTGLEYEKLVELGKTKFKMEKINMQVTGTDEFKEFIANTAEFKDGKAYVQLESGKKLVSLLTETDRKAIQDRIEEKKTMKKRAEEAQSFDEKIGNLINMVKITMMPIVEGLTEALDPLVTELMNGKFKDDLVSLGKDIGEFVTWAAKGLGKFVSTVVDIFGAKGLFLTYLLGSSAKWIANGLLLAQGFLTGTRGFGGFGGASGGGPTGSGPTGGVPSGGTGRFGKFGTMKGGMSFGKSLTRGLGVSAIGGLASAGLEYGREQMEEPNSTGGKLLGAGAKAAEWASYGALIGSVIPGLGTGAGAIIGGLLGAGVGVYDEFNEPQDDAKFPKLGASHSKGRAILQGGKITPIHNKDEVLAMKPGGVVDKTINNQKDKDYTPTKIEFDDININGEIKITLPGGTQIGQEIMKSQEFRSSITRIVTSQLEKNRNGGKTQG